MKQLLLASASVFAFAGAAAAEVTFGGTATLGYNDDDLTAISDDNYGFYWESNLAVTLSQTLDNGVTASVTFDFDVADNDTGSVLDAGSFLLSLTADMGGLYYGDTAYAAQTYWSSVGDMESDDFSASDGEVVLRGEVIFGGVTAGVSYAVADGDGDQYDLNGDGVSEVEQLSVGARGSFGSFSFAMAYQEEAAGLALAIEGADAPDDISDNEIFGVRVATSFSGADIAVGYAMQTTPGGFESTSTGVSVAYPLGPVTLTAYYVMEDNDIGLEDEASRNYGVKAAYTSGPISATVDYQDDQGTTKVALDATYDVGNGITALAGYYTQDNFDGSEYEDEFYVAASVDLGGGADFVLAYADSGDNGDADEIGAPEYERGVTAELTLEF